VSVPGSSEAGRPHRLLGHHFHWSSKSGRVTSILHCGISAWGHKELSTASISSHWVSALARSLPRGQDNVLQRTLQKWQGSQARDRERVTSTESWGCGWSLHRYHLIWRQCETGVSHWGWGSHIWQHDLDLRVQSAVHSSPCSPVEPWGTAVQAHQWAMLPILLMPRGSLQQGSWLAAVCPMVPSLVCGTELECRNIYSASMVIRSHPTYSLRVSVGDYLQKTKGMKATVLKTWQEAGWPSYQWRLETLQRADFPSILSVKDDFKKNGVLSTHSFFNAWFQGMTWKEVGLKMK
jgi:hypothetical protein